MHPPAHLRLRLPHNRNDTRPFSRGKTGYLLNHFRPPDDNILLKESWRGLLYSAVRPDHATLAAQLPLMMLLVLTYMQTFGGVSALPFASMRAACQLFDE